jgi:hypothetical protein
MTSNSFISDSTLVPYHNTGHQHPHISVTVGVARSSDVRRDPKLIPDAEKTDRLFSCLQRHTDINNSPDSIGFCRRFMIRFLGTYTTVYQQWATCRERIYGERL